MQPSTPHAPWPCYVCDSEPNVCSGTAPLVRAVPSCKGRRGGSENTGGWPTTRGAGRTAQKLVLS